ncbi:MAG: hypothetical protein IPO18_03810 [bacterium]|nr:hypothetical protein [bacterium]
MLGSHLKEHEGILVIGDRCLAFDYRYRQEGEAGNSIALDLGQAWLDLTGLPFVFAAWAAAPGLPRRLGMTGVGELTDLMTTSREYGLAHIEEIAAREAAAGRLGHGGESTPAALLYYFCRSLRFRLS